VAVSDGGEQTIDNDTGDAQQIMAIEKRKLLVRLLFFVFAAASRILLSLCHLL
jgi:hypothetical protein